MNTDPTPQAVADALAEILPRRTSVFHVELVEATRSASASVGGCTARARVGTNPHDPREIAGLGETMAEAIVALHNEARGLSEETQHLRRELERKSSIIAAAIEASDNDGGSATDAIQDMLALLREDEAPSKGQQLSDSEELVVTICASSGGREVWSAPLTPREIGGLVRLLDELVRREKVAVAKLATGGQTPIDDQGRGVAVGLEQLDARAEAEPATTWSYEAHGEGVAWVCGLSREDAIRKGVEYARCWTAPNGSFRVAPDHIVNVADYGPDADEALDAASQRICDEVWSDAQPIDASKEAVADLQEQLDQVWSSWVRRHEIEGTAYAVDTSRALLVSAKGEVLGPAPSSRVREDAVHWTSRTASGDSIELDDQALKELYAWVESWLEASSRDPEDRAGRAIDLDNALGLEGSFALCEAAVWRRDG